MFDIAWSELLIVGIVALIVVGPKDLPILLRKLGQFMSVIRRQAAEFRTQFDDAMREAELDQIRKDMEKVSTDLSSTVDEATRSVQSEMDSARREFESATAEPEPAPAPEPVKLSPIAAAAAAAGTSQATAEPAQPAPVPAGDKVGA
jgi:sec-independent protein translocase protein TatB